MGLKKGFIYKRKFINIVQSLIIIVGTAFLLALASFLIIGYYGLVIVVSLWLLMIFILPSIDPKRVLKSYDSRELLYHEVPNLYNGIYRLSKNADLKIPPKLYYIKSSAFIAFSTGTKNNSAIALSDGILRVLDNNELYGVLGHEISHIKNNDIWIMQISDIASKIATSVAYTGQFILLLLSPFLLLSDSLYFFILFFIFLSIPPLSILMQISLSRIREYGADIDAVILTNDSKGLKDALLKLNIIEDNILKKLFNPFSKSEEPSILRTHPSSKNRIKRLEEFNYEDSSDEFIYLKDDIFYKSNPKVTVKPKRRYRIFI